MKTIAYLRVSTNKQDLDNQKFEVDRFCQDRNIQIDEYITEKVSGTKDVRDKKIWPVMEKLNDGDTIVMTEISRVGRNILHLQQFMSYCFEKNIKAFFIKNNIELKNDAHSKFMVSALAFAAEIERDMISSRTKEALALRKERGVVLGRKKGFKPGKKLEGKEQSIKKLLELEYTKTYIAKKYGCSRTTVNNFIKTSNL